MASFALIDPAGAVVEIAAEIFPVPPMLAWTGDISTVTPAPAMGWTAAETAAGVWAFTPPVAPAASLVPAAKAALDASDRVAIRCIKAGVGYPADWQTYDAALRAIVAGGTATALPTMPAYPAGT